MDFYHYLAWNYKSQRQTCSSSVPFTTGPYHQDTSPQHALPMHCYNRRWVQQILSHEVGLPLNDGHSHMGTVGFAAKPSSLFILFPSCIYSRSGFSRSHVSQLHFTVTNCTYRSLFSLGKELSKLVSEEFSRSLII